MKLPKFDEACLGSADEVIDETLERLCFRAREILSTYCLDDFSMALKEETPEEFKSVDDEELELDDVVYHERAAPMNINDSIVAIIDCIPLICDDHGNIQQLIEPGFVSLKIIHNEDHDTIFWKRTLLGVGENTSQIIFRQPWHFDGAAIFEGFCLSEETKLLIDKGAEEELSSFLEDLASSLKYDMKKDAAMGTELYNIQNMPITSIGSVASQYLRDQV